MNALLLIFVALTLVLTAQAEDDNLVISLPDGKIRGSSYITPNNVTYYGWTGIPFASPPVGGLRFQAPQPPRPWSDIMDTTQEASACISIYHWTNNAVESEDCLYLNVYAPVLKPSKKLPVMVFIYGGGFDSGSASKSLFGPDYLIEEDVIIVSFNYRLNSFGFLSTADSEIPGNAGLKDQRLALKWTHANIDLFGGDPEKITIFGESAGGASVGLQLVSSSTAGLYRAAIAQSGTSITEWAINLDPRPVAFRVGDLIGGGNYGNDTKALTQFLQEKTTDEIVNATITLSPSGGLVWPVIEVENEDAFLTEAPYGILESGQFNQVPVILGICSAEWLFFAKDAEAVAQAANLLDSDPSALIPSNLGQNISDNAVVSDAIRNIYLGKGETFSNNYKALVDFFSDNGFVKSIIKHGELAAKYVPVYLYQFSYAGRSFDHFQIDGYELAGHADDLKFLFYNDVFSNVTDATTLLVQDRMVKLWTNFAKFLNPTPEPLDLLENVTWPSIQSATSQFLNINATLSVQSNLRSGYAVWNKVYQNYGRKPFITF